MLQFERLALLQAIPNCFYYGGQFATYILLRRTEKRHTQRFKSRLSFKVLVATKPVVGTINFDGKHLLRTKEIDDVLFNWALAVE